LSVKKNRGWGLLVFNLSPPEAVYIPITISPETDFLIINFAGSLELVDVFVYYV
jgi:hypothetical protein